MLLSFDRVTKFYGPVIGVNNISCRIGPGITGLLGANGAGKSTLIKLASGQLRPSQGTRADRRARRLEHRRQASPGLQPRHEQLLRGDDRPRVRLHHGPAARLLARRGAQRTGYVLEEVGMADRAGRRLAGCSHGMRQRIKLAQALVHDPWLLLLDEPLAGHRSRRPARDQRAAVPPGRAGQDDSGVEPHPGRDRAACQLDRDDVARPDRGLGHAGRSPQSDAISARWWSRSWPSRRGGWRPCWPSIPTCRASRCATARWSCGRATRCEFFAHVGELVCGHGIDGASGCKRSTPAPTPCSTTCSRGGHETCSAPGPR